MDYKIAIYKDKFYKEIKLLQNWQNGLLVGTTKECQMRFYKEELAQDFIVRIQSVNGQWTAVCSESIFFHKKGEDSQSTMQYLTPMDKLIVCDAATHEELFYMDFLIDFVEKTTDYDRLIQCSGQTEITVGGMQGCTIRVMDPVLANDSISLRKSAGGWILDSSKAKYGIQKNGFPVRSKETMLCDRDFFTINGVSFFWKEECIYTASEIELKTTLTTRLIQQQINHLQYPKFVRSARQQFVIPSEKIDILPPKTKPEEPKKNLVMTMVPLLVSMGMMVMLRMAMGGNKMFVLMCVGMGSVSIIMSIINYKNEGMLYRKNIIKRENDYNRYIFGQEMKIQELHEKERIISKQKYPSIEEQLTYVENFDARLFEKQKTHEDYLYVRLGEGTVPSNCEISYKAQEYREVEDPMMDYPEKIHNKYHYISDMPVMLNLADSNAIGFIGDRNHLYQMMKNLILEFCIEHYYQDVKLFFLMGKEDKQFFEWARWFRNTNEDGDMRNFMYDEASSKVILEYLYAQLSEREKLNKENIADLPTNIVFVYRSGLLGEHPVSNYLEKASSLGFVFLFFEDYAEKINPYCSKRVFLDSESYTGYVQDINDGEQIQYFSYQRIPVERASKAALKMACVYVDEVNLESNLTKNITLYQLLDISNVYELDLARRWKHSKIYESMAAPLGVKSGNEIVYLDLHEKFHGPHGLVAGTTGSGKSEILQTYILSMATLFHPYEVGFIIIDFKGGGMVNQFRNLPHLNGAITNIDGKAINRSLASIKAELKKRQRLFAEYEVNHINDYIRLYKQGVAQLPLPHLILIVDEFAELKSEQPEFMKELISAARIGRSLGVHLVLATQKPSGVVNEQIWSNSRFRLCLKVQNQGDSNEVLKSPLAAEIREPGRAYLQVGNNEIFELLQSAYSGAPVPNGAMGQIKHFQISKVSLCGARKIIYEQKSQDEQGTATQLDAIVDYVEEYCKKCGIKRLPDICLPPLEDKIVYTLERYELKTTDICVPIGMYDDPDNQRQEVMDVDFSQGHIFIIGSSQMGKTNLLQTMIRGIAQRYSSDEVHVYIIDFASMIMRNFEMLKHVGGVVTSSEGEKLKIFFQMMEQELSKRKDILSDMGLSSFAAYREAGKKDLSQIVVMIENINALREMYPALDEKLLKIAREGSAVGICLVATALQSAGLGYRYMTNFPKRFALYCNDSGEYSSVLERCRSKLEMTPGKCLFDMDREIFEGQVYLSFPAEREIEKAQEIRKFISETNQRDSGKGAIRIPIMPEIVTSDMIHILLHEVRKPYSIPIGINYDNLEVDSINLDQFALLGISGEKGMGRKNYITYLLNQLLENVDIAPVNIIIMDDEDRPDFEQYAKKVTYYTSNVSKIDSVLLQIKKEMDERYQMTSGRGMDQLIQKPLLCVIMNSRKLYKIIGENQELLTVSRQIVSQYARLKVSFILSDVPNENLRLHESPFLRFLSEANNLLIFHQLSQQKLVDIPVAVQKNFVRPLVVGEAYFTCGTYIGKYKTPIH